MGTSFFDEQTGASAVKAAIVSKYFDAWARVMLVKVGAPVIGYIDLFAGPGRYKDGSKSTPILVLEMALQDPKLRETLWAIFNDADQASADSLCAAIEELPGIKQLKHEPLVGNFEVGEEMTRWLEETAIPKSLVFFDPWGYKGLSLRLLDAALKDWGTDLIFFFNYNRINMGLGNELVAQHMNALFGEDEADALRARVKGLEPTAREYVIVNAFGERLLRGNAEYVLPFRFRADGGKRTSHYLFFASKHVLGYSIMKDIMYRESEKSEDGVARFEYTPVDDPQLSLLFPYSRSTDHLRRVLASKFAGRTVMVDDIIREHHVGTPYVKKNYKAVLVKMEAAGEVTCAPPAGSRPKRNGTPTMADRTLVSFPPQ